MGSKPSDTESYPYIAPCRILTKNAPINWLKAGLNDFKRAWFASLLYGAITGLAFSGLNLLSSSDLWVWVFILGAMVFLSPLLCAGLYAISAQLERNQSVSIVRSLRACFRRYLGNQLIFGLIVLIVFLVWARASSMASIFIPTSEQELNNSATYIMVISLISLAFLSFVFSLSLFALPMIMHRNVDAITAILTSLNAVMRNKLVICIWAMFISLLLLLNVLTFGVLSLLFTPLIGYSVWHGYIDTIDVSAFPRHPLGITAEPVPR